VTPPGNQTVNAENKHPRFAKIFIRRIKIKCNPFGNREEKSYMREI
jgi:hypothetical protein